MMTTETYIDASDNTIFHGLCEVACYRVFFCDQGIVATVMEHRNSETTQRMDITFRDANSMEVINRTL